MTRRSTRRRTARARSAPTQSTRIFDLTDHSIPARQSAQANDRIADHNWAGLRA